MSRVEKNRKINKPGGGGGGGGGGAGAWPLPSPFVRTYYVDDPKSFKCSCVKFYASTAESGDVRCLQAVIEDKQLATMKKGT